MRGVELVIAVGNDDERRDGGDPTAEQLENVQRRLVRPANVLEQQHRRCARPQLLDQHRGNVVARSALLDGRLERSARVLCDLEQRTEWTRREERIADAPQESRLVADLGAEPVDESGLADPGFPGNEQKPTLARPRLGERLAQRLELELALEQAAEPGCRKHPHTGIVITRGACINPDPPLTRRRDATILYTESAGVGTELQRMKGASGGSAATAICFGPRRPSRKTAI